MSTAILTSSARRATARGAVATGKRRMTPTEEAAIERRFQDPEELPWFMASLPDNSGWVFYQVLRASDKVLPIFDEQYEYRYIAVAAGPAEGSIVVRRSRNEARPYN